MIELNNLQAINVSVDVERRDDLIKVALINALANFDPDKSGHFSFDDSTSLQEISSKAAKMVSDSFTPVFKAELEKEYRKAYYDARNTAAVKKLGINFGH